MQAIDIIQYEQLLNKIEKLNQQYGLKVYIRPTISNPEYTEKFSSIDVENKVKCDLIETLFTANELSEVIIFINGFEAGLINKK